MGGHNLQYLPPKIIYRAIRDMEYQEPRLLRNVFWPYINWKMNPKISRYQREWNNKYSSLQWHTMMLFWIRNFIQHFTNIVTDELNEIKKDIRIEKAKERKYKNEMKLIDRVNSGAAGAATVSNPPTLVGQSPARGTRRVRSGRWRGPGAPQRAC